VPHTVVGLAMGNGLVMMRRMEDMQEGGICGMEDILLCGSCTLRLSFWTISAHPPSCWIEGLPLD
jgi:hypothetical protein